MHQAFLACERHRILPSLPPLPGELGLWTHQALCGFWGIQTQVLTLTLHTELSPRALFVVWGIESAIYPGWPQSHSVPFPVPVYAGLQMGTVKRGYGGCFTKPSESEFDTFRVGMPLIPGRS